MTITSLNTVSVGLPLSRLGISLFPVYLPGNNLPTIGTGRDAGLIIEECGQATVPHLVAVNPTNQPILVVEGEQLVGGDQNRTANVSVLVPPGQTINIPVSCLEAGRWGDSRRFEQGRSFAPRRVRRVKHAGVRRSLVATGGRNSDQGAVWGVIDHELSFLAVDSSTSSMADAEIVFEKNHRLGEVVEELESKGPLLEQCGLVVAHGSRVVSAEIFGAPELLQAHWGSLVRACFLEKPTSDGRASATVALKVLSRFGAADSTDVPGVGLGLEHHVCIGRSTGQVLTLDDALVHMSLFRK